MRETHRAIDWSKQWKIQIGLGIEELHLIQAREYGQGDELYGSCSIKDSEKFLHIKVSQSRKKLVSIDRSARTHVARQPETVPFVNIARS